MVIGGGVSGIAIARELCTRYENVFLIERNNQIAQETSSRNSEVIHAGMYYAVSYTHLTLPTKA